tara:strand:+ start:1294 stop:1605 length:312 start_codon:yes stop_codon:yes gene_type:complete
LFYDKVAASPRPGSLQEALCILIQRYRQEQRYYKTLASMHPEGSEGRQEVFGSYKKAMYPYIESTGRRERDQTRELLEEAYLQGPFIIQGLSDKEKHEVKEDE